MVEVGRVNDRTMSIKLVVEGLTYNVISAYALQMGLDEQVKSTSWRIWMRSYDVSFSRH